MHLKAIQIKESLLGLEDYEVELMIIMMAVMMIINRYSCLNIDFYVD